MHTFRVSLDTFVAASRWIIQPIVAASSISLVGHTRTSVSEDRHPSPPMPLLMVCNSCRYYLLVPLS